LPATTAITTEAAADANDGGPVDELAGEDAEARGGDAERVVGHDHDQRPQGRAQDGGQRGRGDRAADGRANRLEDDRIDRERIGLGHQTPFGRAAAPLEPY